MNWLGTNVAISKVERQFVTVIFGLHFSYQAQSWGCARNSEQMLQRDNDQWHSRHVFLSPAVSAHPLFLLSHWMVFPPRRWSRRRSLRNSKCARPSPRWPKSTELMWEKCPPGWIGYWNEYWNDYPICCDANPGHTKYEFSMVAFAIGSTI